MAGKRKASPPPQPKPEPTHDFWSDPPPSINTHVASDDYRLTDIHQALERASEADISNRLRNDIERALEHVASLKKDLDTEKEATAALEGWAEEAVEEASAEAADRDRLEILRDTLTANLPPWAWDTALKAAEVGDTAGALRALEMKS